jgi:hypothetical protein
LLLGTSSLFAIQIKKLLKSLLVKVRNVFRHSEFSQMIVILLQ